MLYIIESRDGAFVQVCHNHIVKKLWNGNYEGAAKAVYAHDSAKQRMAQAIKAGETHIVITSFDFLKSCFPNIEGNCKDNEGLTFDVAGAEAVFIDSFSMFHKVPHYPFRLEHWLRKLYHLDRAILRKDALTWSKIESEHALANALAVSKKASLCAVDIETGEKERLIITSCSYTFLVGVRTITFVIPVHGLQEIRWIRKLNTTDVPKIMQNGTYDSMYFLRFNAPLNNYRYDTYHLFHCMYQELPKTLAFMSSFFLHDFIFWKDEASKDLYQYNAKDTHNTLWVFIAQLMHVRKYTPWAVVNYQHEFPMIFPALGAELEGIAVDENQLTPTAEKLTLEAETVEAELQQMIGTDDFNCRSSKQVLAMMNAMEEMYPPSKRKYYESSNVNNLKSWGYKHPLFQRLSTKILEIRGAKKLTSTYLKPSKFLHNRLLCGIDPSGTETGRSSSSASAFWCGYNLQNIPPTLKNIFMADEGYVFFEVDKSQAESWCTGYLSGNPTLIDILNTSPDFHCSNASRFFGVPFEELYDEVNHKKLNVPLRQLSKKVNHGANYNMGPYVMLQTMGIKNVLKAQKLLDMNPKYSPIRVCAELLRAFDRTYRGLRDKDNGYYGKIIKQVMRNGLLTGPTGYTRRTFLDPSTSKRALNTLVAHPSQSLSVLLVNAAWLTIYKKTLTDWENLVRLKGQIHDSILGQVKIGHEKLVEQIEQDMRIPVKIRGRTMTIPGDVGNTGVYWSELK